MLAMSVMSDGDGHEDVGHVGQVSQVGFVHLLGQVGHVDVIGGLGQASPTRSVPRIHFCGISVALSLAKCLAPQVFFSAAIFYGGARCPVGQRGAQESCFENGRVLVVSR